MCACVGDVRAVVCVQCVGLCMCCWCECLWCHGLVDTCCGVVLHCCCCLWFCYVWGCMIVLHEHNGCVWCGDLWCVC